ncbi:hypothetical protein FisN_18Lh197 [Fistulifera solaris]|uniref:Uncharacterized protein n=1 Tax=Fistulifera solaris TaxID=1519565 RepID=A0A1Z5JU51_FISSO|nr:hypothetical protein FisN_18Lh197 [Fistulifera solaris]|eukprot:GAX17547.1 hypothetical protein FisN_18Lh197 [Fistulifera solaris]
MHFLASQRNLTRTVNTSSMNKLKKSDSSGTLATLMDESSSASWDAAERLANQDESEDEYLDEMIDQISREVAEGLTESVNTDDSESWSDTRFDANATASSLLWLSRDVDGNIWDLEIDDIITGEENVSEVDCEASEHERISTSEQIIVSEKPQPVEETPKAKPIAANPNHFNVQFDKITVREYGIILGDNPACRNGPSVSIGWEYDEYPEILVNDFESIREGNRRTKRGMLMDRTYRVKLLKRLGYADNEIIDAVRVNKKVHQARLQTLSKGIVGSKIVNASRKLGLPGFLQRRSNLNV